MNTVQDELQQIRDQIDLERAKAELAELRGGSRDLLETASDFNVFRNGFLFDDPRVTSATSPSRVYTQFRDREGGRCIPIYEGEDDLRFIRGDARILTAENEAAIGAMTTLANFTLGTGLRYEVSLKKKVAPRGNVRLLNFAQDWIDEFIERTEWCLPEKEFHRRSIEDGEPFVELIPLGGGRCEPEFIEPDQITEPDDARAADDYVGEYSLDWLFGIGSPLGRPNKPLYYFVDRSGDKTSWDIIPAARMVHAKRNVVDNCKRGVSDYYPVAESLRRADKILRNTGDGAALQSAIAWIREHPPGTTGSQVLSLGTGKSEYSFSRTTLGGGSRSVNQQAYLPGTILDVRNGQVYKPGPMGSGSTFVDVSGAVLRYAGLRWNIPEFMISGDTGNTNFASILVAESPFVKAMEVEQIFFARYYRELFWKMLGIAVRAGAFSQFGVYLLRELKQRLKLQVLVPRISVRNRLEETKIRSILYEYGLLSAPTWAAKEELSYEHEQEMRREFVPITYVDPLEAMGAQQQATGRGDQRAAARMRKIGLGVGLGDREFQPQANEPGNVNSGRT